MVKRMLGKVLQVFAFHMIWTLTAGLTLRPASDLTLQNFTLVCDLEGAAWTNIIQFTYGANSGGGCSSPPNSTCFSSIGTMTTSNDQIFLSLSQSQIANIGEQTWTCSHGSVSKDYEATVIAVCTNESVIYEDDKLELSCSCGFPNVTAVVEYLDDSGKSETFNTVLQQSTQTGNCANDGRATDYNLPKPEIVSERMEFIKGKICASFKTQTQYSNPERKCIFAGCEDPLLYGVLPVIFIVLIVSVIISFIMKIKLPVKIYEKFQDLSIGKTGISMALINIVAIGTGLGLGYGLRSGQGKCDKWGLALGLSFLCGVILSVLLIVIILFCCKKEKKDDRETDRSNGDRARSPASASEVKVQTGKISQNKPTVKVKEETKARPLPETPKGRKDQLKPIKPDDGEVENSEQKKKKKKKKKKKEPTEVEKTELQE